MGVELSHDYADRSVLLVGVLKGAAIFLADLARAITVHCTFDFVSISSYGAISSSSGTVRLIKDLDSPIEGRHVILVEDILDTGTTLLYLKNLLLARIPASLKIATLLDKPARRREAIQADYVGFSVPDRFVVGYGLDYGEHYRNLPDIYWMPADTKQE